MDKKDGEVVEMRGGRWLRPHRVAGFLDCTRRHVYDLVREGKLTAIRLGNRDLRISESSVEEYLTQTKVDSSEIE